MIVPHLSKDGSLKIRDNGEVKMPYRAKRERNPAVTVAVSHELDEILRARAAANHRSVTKEVVFLIETALGCSSEQVREAIHLLYKAGIEVTEPGTAQPA